MRNTIGRKGSLLVGCLILGLLLCLPSWAGAADVIKMKYSTFTGPSHPMYKTVQNLLKELEDASGGTVKWTYFGAQALGKAKEHYDIVKEGLADMGTFCCSYTPAQFPLSAIVENPFFCTSGTVATEVIQTLFERGLISDEFNQVHRCFTYATPPSYIFSNKKIESIDDFKGMRINGGTPQWSKMWGILGATNVTMGYPDIYLALQRGTLDAGVTSWSASSFAWKWPEVVSYPIDIAIMGGFHCGYIMNKKSWDKLTPEIQAAWTKIFDKYRVLYAKKYESFEAAGKKKWIDAGREIIEIPQEKQEKMAAMLVPVYTDWIERNEAAGKPAKEIYKTYVEVMTVSYTHLTLPTN